MNSMFKKTFVTLSALLSLGAQAGDPRSGPDLNGVSIPNSVDKLVTTEELKQVQSKCFEEKIAKQILKKIGLIDLSQITLHSYTSLVSQQNLDGFFYLKSEAYGGVTGMQKHLSYNSVDYRLCNFEVAQSVLLSIGSSTYTKSKQLTNLSFCFGYLDKNGGINLNLSFSLPILVFQPSKDVKVYGELGEMIPKFSVKNIKVYGDAVKEEAVYSNQTSQKTALTVDTVSYVDCLKSEIANLP